MTHLLVLLVAVLVFFALKKTRQSKAADWAQTQFDAAAYGLAPRERLDPRRAGPPLPVHRRKESQAIADAAWGGDWRPAAAFVEAAGRDWDERWSRLELLGAIAKEDDAWLTAWRSADPGNCDAATVEASHLVHTAWAIRGSAYAHEVPAADMAKFRELLPAAIEAARRATLLAPENPGPWVVMVTAARGARYQPEQFEPLWSGLVERAPHHYQGHWQAMQYWCAKWFGSDKQMMAFAERAMDGAPEGSPLAGIYLHALAEREERKTVGSMLTAESTQRRLRAVAGALALVPADDERLPALRHLLAHYSGKAELYDVALEQFRAIGPWCGCHPWTEENDPVAAFDLARGTAVKLSKAEPLAPELRPVKDTNHHHSG
ncbi:hypothetical protein [Kitasatospora sp. NPDC088351]|uniref:hypothetical protein n=1 Tax=unclassified Kitasatospora TaxID=2633591 RepID=UPI00343A0931